MNRERFAQLEAAFHDLIAQGLDDRAEILRRYDDEDPSFAHALRDLLAAHEAPIPIDKIAHQAADALLHESEKTTKLLDGAVTSVLPPERDRAIPDRIGAYRVCRIVGEGGMGTVYEAEQESPRRRVAVKVLRHDVAGLDPRSPLWRRFVNEAHALGRLRHPGIAHVHEAGTYDAPTGARPFLVMEFIDGPTLPQALATRSLTLPERLAIMLAIVDAVAYAHGQGVIHRDLKPSNVMIDADGRPRILDFGLARLNDARIDGLSFRTEHGQIMGTLAYMSPEQLSGRSDDVTERSDVYALGVMLYELLAGRLPHELRGMPLPEAARIVRDEEPSRLGSIDRSLRGDLETIAATAMAKEPRMRYPSAAAMADDLRRHLADEPIIARPPSALYQWRKFARRHRGLVGGIATAFIVLIGATIALAQLASRERTQRSLAEARAAEAIAGRYRAALLSAQSAIASGNAALAERSLDEAPLSQRGWEFAHLRWLASQSIATVDVGGAPIAMSVDASGSRIALLVRSESAPHASIRLVQLTTNGLELEDAALPLQDPPLNPVLRLSPDGRWLALIGTWPVSGGPATSTWMIDLNEMRVAWHSPLRVPSAIQPFLVEPRSGLLSIAVQSLDDRGIEFLACESGASLRRLDVGSTHAFSIAIPALPMLVCWLDVQSQTVAIDLRDETRVWRMDARALTIEEGRDSSSHRVYLRDAREGIAVNLLSGAIERRELLAASFNELLQYSRDRRLTLTVSGRGRATLRSALDGSLVRTVNATVAQFVPGRDALLRGSDDGLLHLTPICDSNGAPIGPVIASVALWTPGAAALSPDGSLAATMHWGLLHCHDTVTGAVLWSRCVSRQGGAAIAFDHTSQHLATLDTRGTVRVFDARRGTPLKERADRPAVSIIYDERGDLYALRPPPESVFERVAFDTPESTAQRMNVRHASLTSSGHLAFIHDDRVTFTHGPTIPTNVRVIAADLDRTGTRASLLSHDGQLTLWECDPVSAPARQIAATTMTGLDTWGAAAVDVPRLLFSPDGKRLVVSDVRGDIHLFDTERLGELIVLQVPALRVVDLRFSPDGSRLLATGGEHAVVAFETALDSATAMKRREESRTGIELRDRLRRDMTIDEARRSITAEIHDPAAREHALQRSYSYVDDANRLNSLAWGMARVAERDDATLARAMEYVQAAHAAFPNDHGILNTRAAVEYRLGRYTTALATLDRCDERSLATRGERDVMDLLFRVMSLAGLERREEAIALLRDVEPRVEALIARPVREDPTELSALLREAQQAVGAIR